jgi:diguanylate cyclase (GGDEF)-like protein
MTDPLTGVLNRRGMTLRLNALASAPSMGDTLASWIMLDIDHFKNVNDNHGHDGGDVVLKQIAALLRSCSREGDIVVRLGGEEFLVVLPGVSHASALATAERLRHLLEVKDLFVGVTALHITASFGVCTQTRDLPWHAALRAADGALYEAKASGRNKVVAVASVARLISAQL